MSARRQTQVNENVVNGMMATTSADSTVMVRKEDLAVITKWVKHDLFDKVMFLYNRSEDLKVNNPLYHKFVKECSDKLIGLKNGDDSDRYKSLYCQALWMEANAKKNRLIDNGLASRRSSVYAGMQNRFNGKSSLFTTPFLPNKNLFYVRLSYGLIVAFLLFAIQIYALGVLCRA